MRIVSRVRFGLSHSQPGLAITPCDLLSNVSTVYACVSVAVERHRACAPTASFTGARAAPGAGRMITRFQAVRSPTPLQTCMNSASKMHMAFLLLAETPIPAIIRDLRGNRFRFGGPINPDGVNLYEADEASCSTAQCGWDVSGLQFAQAAHADDPCEIASSSSPA